MSGNLDSLPEGWEIVEFDLAINSISDNGNRVKKGDYLEDGLFPVIDQGEQKIGGYTNNEKYVIKNPLPIFVFGDHTRRFKYMNVPFAPGADGVKLLAPTSIWNNMFLYYQLSNLDIENKGYSRHYQILRKKNFKLAPKQEQTRIVEKLDELLSDLDNGVAELKAAQNKLTQYRQSLLKSAVEGSLTAEWREAQRRAGTGKTSEETGEQLLARILTERRERWETQKLAEFKEKGKKPPKDWQLKYPEPVQPDTSGLPELPDGWVWASVDQLALNKRYGSSSKTNDDSNGVPVLRMGNIQDGELDYTSLKYLPQDHTEFPELLLSDGDLLFNRTNSAELVGKTAVYRDIGKPCSYASYLISVTFCEYYRPGLAAYFINSVLGKAWIAMVMNQTAGQANVNGTKLGELAIPLPPISEQKQIVSQMNNLRELIQSQLNSVEIGLKKLEAQRKNILKDAFSGRLVKQDPKDESTSVLLEKIKAERELRAKELKPMRSKKKPEAMKSLDTQTLKNWIANQTEENFTFAQIQSELNADYDALKDIVFQTLSEQKAVFEQFFDEDQEQVIFRKINI